MFPATTPPRNSFASVAAQSESAMPFYVQKLSPRSLYFPPSDITVSHMSKKIESKERGGSLFFPISPGGENWILDRRRSSICTYTQSSQSYLKQIRGGDREGVIGSCRGLGKKKEKSGTFEVNPIFPSFFLLGGPRGRQKKGG